MSIAADEERQLIRRARSGENQAFDQLVIAYTPQLYRVIRRMTVDAAEAEAVLQEAFWRVWRSLPRYREDRPFFPYLVTIAMNVWRDHWRSSRKLDFRELDVIEEVRDESDPETQLDQAEELRALAKAVAALPEVYRTVIALRYDAELSYEEIAKTLKIPVNTVRTHIYRAKECLRKELARVEYGR